MIDIFRIASILGVDRGPESDAPENEHPGESKRRECHGGTGRAGTLWSSTLCTLTFRTLRYALS
ncbi:hypothetical protein [Azospirillum sp. TSH7]|uniref:hypothetical protein n=1 Tax=Azospirillum sp. TSH7 TaxID=652751 RepID=UPI0011B22410|nr:hypothetical protein [Azospirillum sp. TSH7]